MGTVEWIVLLSVGVLVGLGLGFFLGRIGGRGNSQKLADVEAELEEYRQNVSEHFSRSAEHFQAIGRQYRELYEHMAAGSEKLCVGAPSEGQLKFPRPDEVTAEKPAETKTTDVKTEDAVEDNDAAALRETAESEPDSTGDQPADREAADESTADDKKASPKSEDLETAKAPADFVDDNPKERQYH